MIKPYVFQDTSKKFYRKGSAFYRFVKFWVWFFTPKLEALGVENLPDGPCIIAGNHSHMMGPIAAELYIPKYRFSWCIAEMLHREEVASYAFQDFWSGKPKWTHWFYKLLSHIIAPLSVELLGNAYTVGVYKDRRVLQTFKESVEKMQDGASMVIFPECYDEHNNIVHEFQRGFVDVAKMYYRQTKESVPFVPMYVCPKLKKVIFGQPIYYDPDRNKKEETERICNYLMDQISEIAYALPLHTVVPYPNIPKRDYPSSARPN